MDHVSLQYWYLNISSTIWLMQLQFILAFSWLLNLQDAFRFPLVLIDFDGELLQLYKYYLLVITSAFVYRYVLESEHMKKFFDYIQVPNFDISSDAAATFKVEFH